MPLLFWESQKRYYSSPWLSAATFYTLLAIGACFVSPFIITYYSGGLWLKFTEEFEQPFINFRYEMLMKAYSSQDTLFWSTSPTINQYAAEQLRTPSVTVANRDYNFDGKIDEIELRIQIPLDSSETINGFDVLLFFNYSLTTSLHLNMTGAVHLRLESSTPSSAFTNSGKLQMNQIQQIYVPGQRLTYNYPVYNFTNTTANNAVAAFDFAGLLRSYHLRNETLYLQEEYRMTDPVLGTIAAGDSSYTIRSYMKVQPNRILQRPSAVQTVKMAWVQYLSILILFYIGGMLLSHFLFTQQIIQADVSTESHLLAPNNVSHPRDRYKLKKFSSFSGREEHSSYMTSRKRGDSSSPTATKDRPPEDKKASHISVTPSVINISNVVLGKTYEVVVTIRNLAVDLKPIRVTLPSSDQGFSLRGVQGTEFYAAYGLDKKVTLEYIPQQEKECTTRIIVKSDVGSVEIPVYVTLPAAEFHFGQNEISFGNLVLNQSLSKTVTVHNKGQKGGEFSIAYDTSVPLQITPARGYLDAKGGAKSSVQITIRLDASVAGLFKSTATLEANGQSSSLDIMATVVSQSLELMLPDGRRLDTIHFGSIYFGQERSFSAVLVNNGPHPSSFRTLIDSKTEDEELLMNWSEMIVEPSEGTIDPMSRTELVFRFTPVDIDPQLLPLLKNMRIPKSLLNPQREYSRIAFIAIVETGQSIEIPLTARAIKTVYDVSANNLNFGDTFVNSSSELTFTLTNRCEELPINYHVQKVAHFKTVPSNGKLLPLQSQEISVVFAPKQMGVFRHIIELNICNGISIAPLHLKGNASFKPGSGDTATLKLPPIKTPESPSRSTWKRAGEVMISLQPDTEAVDSFQRRKENGNQYTQFIRASHAARVARKLQERAEETIQDVDMDMQPGAGLLTPRLQLPKVVDSYFGNYKNMVDRLKLRKKARETTSEDVLIKKKFKSKPTTQLEMRECKAKLSRADLFQNVTAGNKMFDFGTVCVYSQNTKSFNITNNMKQSLLVALVVEHEELKKSSPSAQVIPPGATAGFDVVLCSTTPQSFYNTISYTINGQHTYIITITADVSPINLDLSKEQINFRFSPDSLSSFASEMLTLTNPFNQVAEFKCANGPNFVIEPSEGIVKPHSSLDMEVKFLPDSKMKYEETILIKVNGGPDKAIRCFSKLGKVDVVCSHKVVDFEIVAVGLSKTQMISLMNTSSCDAFVHAESTVPELSVSPKQACIRAGASLEMELKLKPTKRFFYEIELNILVPGGKSLKIRVKARADVPNVIVEEESFDYGNVYVGATSRLPLTLSNTSIIPAMVICDLSAHSEFFVVIANQQDGDISTKSTRLTADVQKNSKGPKSHRLSQRSIVAESLFEEKPQPGSITMTDSICRITVDAGKSLHLDLVYKPNQTVRHQFALPMFISGIAANIVGKEVTAQSDVPPLTLTEMVVQFGPKVVLKEGFKTQPYHNTTTLTNDSNQDLVWEIGSDHPLIESGIFQIEPRKGTLEPRQCASVRVSFYPREREIYQATVPIHLDNKRERVLFEFEVRGEGIYPMITFDTREVVLPIVPLNVTSEVTFRIVNQGYERLDFDYKLPVDKNLIPIEIEFPEGTTLTSSNRSVPAIVRFRAVEQPLSFTSKIDFFDNGGQKFSVLVSGASDNSLLTCFQYIQSTSESHEFKLRKGKGVLYEERDEPTRLDGGDRNGVDPMQWIQKKDDVEKFKPADFVSENLLKTLSSWLNGNALKNSVQNFPGEIIEGRGGTLFDLAETLSGRKIPFSSERVVKSSENSLVNLTVQRYEIFLNFLRSLGGLFGALKPEFLLSWEEFHRYRNLSPENKMSFEGGYPKLSALAWSTIVFQMIKLFYLNRVTIKSFKGTPGIQGNITKQDLALYKGNVYGTSEQVLLKWVNIHARRMNPNSPRVVNFDRDFRDGLIFSSLLLSHCPQIKRLTSMYQFCSLPEHFEHNASHIVNAVKDLGLDYPITPKDILSPNPVVMLLFVWYLFMHLPQFIPKSTIEFKGTLLEKLVKELELSNPTAAPVSYTVSVEGSNDFSIPEHSIHLEPKDTKFFPVHFLSKLSRPSEGRLIFHARRKGQTSFILTFNLRGTIDQQKPTKVVELECKLYDHFEFPVEIRNPLQLAGKFKISLQQETRPTPIKDGKGERSTKIPKELPDSFVCLYDQLTLSATDKAVITLQLVPFVLGTHVARIILVDDKVGEFMYLVEVKVILPTRLDTIQISCEERTSADRTITIPHNYHYTAALQHIQKLMTDMEGRREQLRKILAILPAEMPSKFRVEYSSPFYSGPVEVQTSKDKMDTLKLGVNFHPKESGYYNCRLLMTSLYDVRVVEVEGTSTAKSTVQSLDFVVAARQSITQHVPIRNNTNKDWTFKVTLQAKGFSGPMEFVAAAGQVSNYPLVFKPQYKGSFSGVLTMSNFPTGEFVYNLKGVGEDPLPEDHIVIECQAKSRSIVKLPIKNPGNINIDYRVESDVPYVSGPNSIKMAPLEPSKFYELVVLPQCSGRFQGVVKFSASEENFIFFTVEVQASPPPPEQKLEISSIVRSAVAAEISIRNPLDEAVEFEVTMEGDGLFGEPTVLLGAKENGIYQLIYYPIVRGDQEGSVMFFSESVGEFWYKLRLMAESGPPTVVEPFECSLGSSQQKVITLNNPTNDQVALTTSNTTPGLFTIHPEQVSLSPFSSTEIRVTYSPAALDRLDTSTLTFSHADIGEWVYSLSGRGTEPTDDMDVTYVHTSPGDTVSGTITFSNPFGEAKDFWVRMTERMGSFFYDSPPILSLDGFESIEIPFGFSPDDVDAHHSAIMEVITEKGHGDHDPDDDDHDVDSHMLTWRYPIVGCSRIRSDRTINVSGTARTKQVQSVELLLTNYSVFADLREELWTVDLEFSQSQSRFACSRALQAHLTNISVSGGAVIASVDITFAPLKTLREDAELVLKKNNGSSWVFPVDIESTPWTQPDDTLVIESHHRRPSGIAFRLPSQFDYAAEFHAYISESKTLNELSVEPTKGNLKPVGEEGEGALIRLKFVPTSKTAPKSVAKLMIESEEMEWSFDVRYNYFRTEAKMKTILCLILLSSVTAFYNPVYPKRFADPWVYKLGKWYYLTASTGLNNITILRSKDFSNYNELSQNDQKVVWKAPPAIQGALWAPEMHLIQGSLYIYFSGTNGTMDNAAHRMYVLKAATLDPFGEWNLIGKISTPDDNWAIDGTVWQRWNGRYTIEIRSFLISTIEATSSGQAEMKSPIELKGERVLLHSPTQPWMRSNGQGVNEGPEILINGDFRFLIYSAAGSWGPDYCLGMMELMGDDPLDPTHWWSKDDAPVFRSGNGVYGPGHCSFTQDDAGRNYIFYHATTKITDSWPQRRTRVEPFHFGSKGWPVFPNPPSNFTQKIKNPKINRSVRLSSERLLE
ncbi:hypothetical protein PROFUN_00934 [Planoprotostelium fungivorum]|uniref:Calponin-homology (CH) domain-containing protein n=1 Tax=Planoprotostelium fungivorum TaxID=1890364 RepID=A0A2P6N496_9EUKA|nr:hypothetical protein PROFUN_00934 [Planoprotostelium fungivorum]